MRRKKNIQSREEERNNNGQTKQWKIWNKNARVIEIQGYMNE